MDLIIELLYILAHNRFVFLMISVLLILLMRFAAELKELSSFKKKAFIKGSSLLLLSTLLIFIFGSDMTNKLIDDYGQFGEGVVVEKKETGDLYNEEPVIRFETLIKTRNDETVQTSFDSDHFNLYPALDDLNAYPDIGLAFTVKYLKRNPKVFVIITDDNSAYATSLHCSDLLKKLDAAKSKLDFNPNDIAYKKQYEEYKEAYLSSKCDDVENKGQASNSLVQQKKDGNNPKENGENPALPTNGFIDEFLVKKDTLISRPWFPAKWNLPENKKPSFISEQLIGHILPKITLENGLIVTCKEEVFHFAELLDVNASVFGDAFYKPEHWSSKFDMPILSYEFNGPLSFLLVTENSTQIVEIDSIFGDSFFTFHPRQELLGELQQALVPIIYNAQFPEHIDFATYLSPKALKMMVNSKSSISTHSVAYGDKDYPGTLTITYLDLDGNGEADIIRIKDDVLDLVSPEEDEDEGFAGDYILAYVVDEWYLTSYRIDGYDGLEGY